MSKIHELELKLEKLKKEKAEKEQALRLEKHRKDYVGKCYSTHQFHRFPSPGKTFIVRHILDVEIQDDGKVFYRACDISFKHHESKFGVFGVDITLCSTQEPWPSWLGSFSHEITLEQFQQLKAEVKQFGDDYFEVFRNNFKRNEYITIGEVSTQNQRWELVKKAYGEECLLKVTGGPTSFSKYEDRLVWGGHPFIYRRPDDGVLHILLTKESIDMVKYIAKVLEDEANRSFTAKNRAARLETASGMMQYYEALALELYRRFPSQELIEHFNITRQRQGKIK